MLEVVGRYFDPWEAHIVRALLGACDIPAFVIGDQHMIMNWPICIALGGARLMVPRNFAVAAADVLNEYESGCYLDSLTKEFPEAVETCPACGSSETRSFVPNLMRGLAILTTLIAGAPFPASESKVSCLKCRHRWNYAA